ncbi:hypothetical protein P7C70_g2897, partial [Phenoliferia sp. Uapishka_3]
MTDYAEERSSELEVLESIFPDELTETSERERIIEEATAIKVAGTKVTVDSFNEWKVRFEQEMKEKAKRDEADRIKALPPKEREEVKKFLAKYSGRQLFEKDLQGTLVSSDAQYDEEGAVSVDASQYERVDHLSDEEEEVRNLGDLSDDD